MRLSRFGITFTCSDLRATGIIDHCCIACHGWDEWFDRPAGLTERHLGNGKRLVSCCACPRSRSNHWYLWKLQAHHEDLRIERRPPRKRMKQRRHPYRWGLRLDRWVEAQMGG
jgi:hypothetical protein